MRRVKHPPSPTPPSPSHLDQHFCRDTSVYFRHQNPGAAPTVGYTLGGLKYSPLKNRKTRQGSPLLVLPAPLPSLPSPEMKISNSGGQCAGGGRWALMGARQWTDTRRSPTVRPFPPPSLPSLPSPVPTPRARSPPPPPVDPQSSHHRSTTARTSRLSRREVRHDGRYATMRRRREAIDRERECTIDTLPISQPSFYFLFPPSRYPPAGDVSTIDKSDCAHCGKGNPAD